MTSDLNKFEMLRKDNKWNYMSPEQEQIIALSSVVEKLKDKTLKLAKNFKTSSPIKIKARSKGRGSKHQENQLQ